MTPRPRSLSTARGFTLIELMITVSIVAILAAIAYPAYKDSVLKSKRAQGRAALLDLMTQQERYLTQNNSYLSFAVGASGNTGSDGLGTSGNTSQPVPFKTWSGDNINTPAYKLGARLCPAYTAQTSLRNCVQLFATPQYTDPSVTELTITSTGVKACSPSTTAQSVCWP